MLAVLCALACSLMYALASVLQQRGAAVQPEEHSLRLGLLTRLLRNPGWVLGLACDGAGYVLQFIALDHGPLVIVQPLLVCGLLFALPLGAAWAGRRLGRADWLSAVLVCAGLAAFLTVARPASGRNDAPGFVWTLMLVSSGAVALVLIGLGRNRPQRQRAVLLSGAAGVVYGATAALTKTSAHLLDKGILPVLTHWQPYVLLGAGVWGMVMAQSAFQAGFLDASLPTMSVVDPVVSIAIGAFAFQEGIAAGPGAVTVEAVALLVMCVGVVFLARSQASSRHPDEPSAAPDTGGRAIQF